MVKYSLSKANKHEQIERPKKILNGKAPRIQGTMLLLEIGKE